MVALVLSVLAACEDLHEPVYPLSDELGLLDPQTAERVRQLCVALERETSAEIGVLIFGSTGDVDIRSYGARVHSRWGVGKPGKHNGVLVLFAVGDRRMDVISGQRYRSLFTRPVIDEMISRIVSPRMRTGRRPEAVERCVFMVADRIRRHEASTPRPGAADPGDPPGAPSAAATFGQQRSGVGRLLQRALRPRFLARIGLAAWLLGMTGWFLLMFHWGWRRPPRRVVGLLALGGPAWYLVLEVGALSSGAAEQDLWVMVIGAAAALVALFFFHLAPREGRRAEGQASSSCRSTRRR